MPKRIVEKSQFPNEVFVPADGEKNFGTTIIDGFQRLADRTQWLKDNIQEINTQGLQGLMGATGPRGQPGERGPIGEKGATGPTGEKGPLGPPGNNSGATGVQGPRGLIGPKGNDGATGAKGYTGSTGIRGEKGDRGERGPSGLTGQTGPIGPKGNVGPMGATGSQGPKGDTGATGLQGLPGTNGTATVQVTHCDYPFETTVYETHNKSVEVSLHKCTASLVDAKGENFEDVDVRLLNHFPGFIKIVGSGDAVIQFPETFGIYESIIECDGVDVILQNGHKWLYRDANTICQSYSGKMHIRVVTVATGEACVSVDFYPISNTINIYEYTDKSNKGIQVNFSTDSVGYIMFMESVPSGIVEPKIYKITKNDTIIPFVSNPTMSSVTISYSVLGTLEGYMPSVTNPHGEIQVVVK